LPTIRADASEIWFSWNPDQPTDPVDAFFLGGLPDAVHVHTTYEDNPFCPDVMRAEAARLKAADEDAFEHVWMGGYFFGGNGRVYSSFISRPFPAGNVDEGVKDIGGELLVGMDFNVNPMSAVLAIRVVDECHVLDALEVPTSNTEEMAAEIRRRYPNRRVIVCPDPAGKQRHTNAPVGQTDFTILQRAKFEVRAPNAAPPVVDRINNAQAMFLADGRRRVRIHPKARPLITGLANLTYKEGTSIQDKKSGFDHICDALGYLLWQEFNVLTPSGRWGSSSHGLY
jgi:phage terminase large subunit